LLLEVGVHGFGRNLDLSSRVAFVSLTTAQSQKPAGSPEAFAPHVLLRFSKQGSSSGFPAMTGEYGVAVIPIEAGTYCAEAYGLDRHEAELSPRSKESQHRCFKTRAGKMVEFGVTLAAAAKYGGKIPSLGVE
jgi:hypothetical protein